MAKRAKVIAELLLTARADVNIFERCDGNTPLHIAIYECRYNKDGFANLQDALYIVELFLRYNKLNVYATNNVGQTAWDLAQDISSKEDIKNKILEILSAARKEQFKHSPRYEVKQQFIELLNNATISAGGAKKQIADLVNRQQGGR